MEAGDDPEVGQICQDLQKQMTMADTQEELSNSLVYTMHLKFLI